MPRKNNRNSYNYRNIERDVRDIQRAGKRFKKSWINADGPLERILILLVVVAVIGVTIGMLLPKVNPTVGEITGEYTATGTAAETLEKLTVDDNPSKAGYDRDAFGFRETDDDGNGCDVREDVLARDLTDVQYKNGRSCQVASGTLDDPYTGQFGLNQKKHIFVIETKTFNYGITCSFDYLAEGVDASGRGRGCAGKGIDNFFTTK